MIKGWIDFTLEGHPIRVKYRFWPGSPPSWDDPGDGDDWIIDEGYWDCNGEQYPLPVRVIEMLNEEQEYFEPIGDKIRDSFIKDYEADRADAWVDQKRDEEMIRQAEEEDL